LAYFALPEGISWREGEKVMRRFWQVLLIVGLVFYLAGFAWAQKKVAYIPCGRVNDGSWSQAGYEGVLLAKQRFGVEIAYVESPAQADVETHARDFALKGYNPIILHCALFAHVGPKLAPEFPNTWFLSSNGVPPLPKNLALYEARHEFTFVAGVLAGLMSKRGVIGTIGGFNFPELNREIEALKLGARFANPRARFLGTFINSWEDAAKAKEAAMAQLDAGADVVFAATDQAARGAFKAAEERGAYAVASYADQNFVAPKTILTSVVYRYDLVISNMVEKVLNGTIESKAYIFGVAEGVGFLAPNPAMAQVIPKEVQERVDGVLRDIKAKKIVLPPLTKVGDAEKVDLKTIVR
jgi:basic membrane lipoprotein Med (substrate-binding protein (PBP1-ABC) superfamily)